MKAQFDHQLLMSFYLWFENQLLKDDIKAYKTGLSNTFKYVDFNDVPNNFVGYQGQFRQLVAEDGVDTPNSGFFVDGGFVTGNNSENGGVYTDYNNGRIIFPAASGQSLNITANSTVKEVNTYTSNDDDLSILLHSDFIEEGQSEQYLYSKEAKLDEKAYFLPACIVSLVNSENEEFAFGGEEDTKSRIRVIALAKNEFILDGIVSKCRDLVRNNITHIPYDSLPYGQSFTLKSFPYQYDTLKEAQGTNALVSHINKVSPTTVVSETVRQSLNKNIGIAFIDFDLSTYRFPRS
jgi:hypothetical protein